ncbi:pirin family protein [Streptomyces albiaxialis]
MSNTEARPQEVRCTGGTAPDDAHGHPPVQILEPRDVPLGGVRAMAVRRTLPQRARSLIGAWCFADHYGPTDVRAGAGMDVPPHPHIGLQTVSWLFSGEIEHRDSLGTHAFVRPGELNLMTGGHGICHSEVSTERTALLHGVQLWVALPGDHRDAPRAFQHHVPAPVEHAGATVRVLLGSLCGQTSPVETFTPLLGAELLLPARAELSLDVDPAFEHGVLVDSGTLGLEGTALAPAELGFTPPGRDRLHLTNTDDAPARVILLGGEPFEEDIIMWWNFVGGSHEDIVQAREDWMAGRRFGEVTGYDGAPLPAPPLPNATLKPRSRPS